jgi:catechol 2,3-dioxygenase-like lactoylglutathione lyase family enzyme
MSQIYHRGRLIDHIHLRVSDLAASKRFYKAVLATLGREPNYKSDDAISFDELWIDAADSAGPSRVHFAFQAEDQDAVKMARQANANITPAIMPASCSIRTGTMSKRCCTGRPSATLLRWR